MPAHDDHGSDAAPMARSTGGEARRDPSPEAAGAAETRPAVPLDVGHGITIGVVHRRRLREVWRSAGWPCQDMVEAELLVAGLLERKDAGQGRERLRVSDAGLRVLVQTAAGNRSARNDHERLVRQVAAALARDGRIAWCGLALRARVTAGAAERWQMAVPDVYSVRHTSVAAYLQPQVHEIKVRRADLLADLRRPTKRAAYLQMAGAVYYVLAEGIGGVDDVPPECGVIVARAPGKVEAGDGTIDDEEEIAAARLDLLRPAMARPFPHEAGLPFGIWMALARATPAARAADPQLWLGAAATGGSGEHG